MKKLSFIFLVLIILSSCNTIKHVQENQQLLTKNNIYIDSIKKSNTNINELLLQKPNAKVLGIPLSLYFYNIGDPNGSKTPSEWGKRHPKNYNFIKKVFSEKQSISVANTFIGFNEWFLKSGQAPVIIDDSKIKKTEKNLEAYFQNEGYFKAKINSKRDTVAKKKGSVSYYINKGKALFLDTIKVKIASPVLDSLYAKYKEKTFLKSKDQYKDANFIKEANRVTKLFRNNGVYHFDKNSSIDFYVDTTTYKTNVDYEISDRVVEENGKYINYPYKIQTIKKVNVFTDYSYNKRNDSYKDSISKNSISYFSHDKLRYNPKYLSQSIYVKPNEIYSDSLRRLTITHLRSLKNFKSTSIQYRELDEDNLEANIFLTPTEKYTLGIETELSRSNIRNFDISAKFSLTNRNTFKGAELFRISTSGAYFNSNNGPGWELGTDVSLEIPRFIAPFGISKLVPKRMFPRTKIFSGINIQRNIGLDKQNITVGLNYNWRFDKRKSIQLDILNTQYVRNLNISNYFQVFNSEYNKLQTIDALNTNFTLPANTQNNADGILTFLNNVTNDSNFEVTNPVEYREARNISNRYNIITTDFIIPEIAYSYTYNNQENTKDASFSYLKIRVANSGNIMGLLSNSTNSNGNKTVFKIPIAQYFKTDIEYKKYWSLAGNSVLAHRTFLGAIITYDNSNIPFSRSYFAGGSNDIRAWRTFALGPGTTRPGLEYNIGSLKFLSSFEYRFDLFGSAKGALFVDAGNIWDITNSSFTTNEAKFSGLKSLKDIAVGTGFGLRYDFSFLVARLDIGFKTHEPYLSNNKWFNNFNFSNAVYNLGINYPF